jgi:presenilin-like A22 family membrane protease
MADLVGFLIIGVLVRMLDPLTVVIATGVGLGASRQIDFARRWLVIGVSATLMAAGVLMLVGQPLTTMNVVSTMNALSQVTASFLQIAIASELFRHFWPPKRGYR